MTALNAIVLPDAAHLFTDGGLYDADSLKLIGVGNKVQMFPHLNAALTSNGWAAVGYMLWDALTEPGYRSFDDMAAGFGNAIKSYANKNNFFPVGNFEAVLIGWSEIEDAPQAFVVSNVKTSVDAFVPRQVSKNLTPYDLTVRAIPFDPDKPAEYGLAVMERQRAAAWDTTSGKRSVKAVGGFAQHTRIDRDGITVKMLRHWPE